MISGIFFASARGDILLSRYFRSDVNESMNQLFRLKVILPSDIEDLPPVTHLHNTSFLHICVDNVFVVAVTGQNANTFVLFEFLYQLVQILKASFGGKFSSKQIKQNVALIHELLEEIIDFGYPQVTDTETLKLYITQGNINATKLMKEEKAKKITTVATGQTPWRPPDIVYKKNELWIDVIEKVNLLVSHQGAILKSDVDGEIHLKCNLSGMPQCEFGMNDRILFEKDKSKGKNRPESSISLDDLSFHQCVRLTRFENDRIVSFVPPDGEFVLMRYRSTERITLPYRIVSQVKFSTPSRLDYEVTLISEYPAKLFGIKVEAKIPTPPSTAVCKISLKGNGKAKYDPQAGGIVWRIKRFPGHSEITLRATVDLIATAVDKVWDRPPISLDFTVPMFGASGMKIRFLRVTDSSGYTTSKWVRYLTKGGSYQRRL